MGGREQARMASTPTGNTIRLAAGILLASLSLAVVATNEGLRSAAFSAVGSGLSPGEASITYRLFNSYELIHGLALGIALASLLMLNRWALPGHWAPVSPAWSRRLRILSRLGIGVGLSLAVVSLTCGRFLYMQWSYTAANYMVALALMTRLWLTVAMIPFPRDRFAATLHRPEINPFVFCGLAIALACAALFIRGPEPPPRQYVELTAEQLRTWSVYPPLLTASNTLILSVLVLAACGLTGRLAKWLRASTTWHLLACWLGLSAILGLILARALMHSCLQEMILLDLRPVLWFMTALLALLLPLLLFCVLRMLDHYFPDRLSSIPSPVPLILLPLAVLPAFWAVPLCGLIDRRSSACGRRGRPRMTLGWTALHVLTWSALVVIGYYALFGFIYNPWYKIWAVFKSTVLKCLCISAAGLILGYLYHATRRTLMPNIGLRALAGIAATVVTLIPFARLHRQVEGKHSLMQFTEFTKLELDFVKFITGLGTRLHVGEITQHKPGYQPCPKPWTFSPAGRRDLPQRVNYIVIMVDALRADVLGRLGCQRKDITPFLDRWTADECVFFENAYSQSNGTFNSLPMILGGRGNRRDLLPGMHDENMLYQLMVSEGIDRRYSFLGHGIHNLYPLDDPRFISLGVPYRLGFSNHDQSVKAADCFERLKTALSAAPGNETFFAYVHLMDVHNDLFLKEEARNYGDSLKDLYDNNVNYLDLCLRDFVGWLKTTDRYANTVMAITSDHGEEFDEHMSSMHGHNFYQEDIHVPLILRLPGIAARTIATGVSTSDLTPTLLDLAGWTIAPPYDNPAMGISVRDLILAPEHSAPRFARRDLLLVSSFTEKYGLLRDFRYKLVYWVTYESYALFDLKTDPHEKQNIISRNPELASDMKRIMLQQIEHIRGIRYTTRLPWESE